MIDPKLGELATEGIAILLRQLGACAGWLQYGITGMSDATMPTTAASYRHVRGNMIATIQALEDFRQALGGTTQPVPNIPVELTNVGHVAGFVEHALVRLGVLVCPMSLDTLPDGVPGQKDFESEYHAKVKLSRSYGVAADHLQQLHRLLGSDCHRLDLPEEVRAINWREARKCMLILEVERLRQSLEEVRKFEDETGAQITKLEHELDAIRNGSLFAIPATLT